MSMYPPAESPMSPFQLSVAANNESSTPSTNIHLSISVSGLRNRDVTSLSDPFCVLFVRDARSKQWMERGRTEVIKDTLSPQWQKMFNVQYRFEERQELRFSIYDSDGRSSALDNHDFLGRIDCSMGEIVSASGGKFIRKLEKTGGTPTPLIIIQSEEAKNSNEDVSFKFIAKGLDKKDFLGKSDPFLTISRFNTDGSTSVVHRTEVCKNTLNPEWRPFTIPLVKLCNGDYDRRLRFDCADYDDDGSHDHIGSFTTTLRTLVKGPSDENKYSCINEKKRAKKSSYKNSGVIYLTFIKVEKRASFVDYIKGGTQLHFTVAVDFTASNGPPQRPNSLHYRSANGVNQYTTAINAVGEIIQDYDTDKMFPALGFGAKVPPHNQVCHEFPLNFNDQNPYCHMVNGVLEAYYNALSKVQLYGPTNFSPVINHVAKFAKKYQDGDNYFILLILTDGIISDMEDTKAALVDASSLPMSVIIVGVGREDFSAMNELDGDDGRLMSRYKGYAKRDIVQFVPLRNFIRPNEDWHMCKVHLAQSVLAEVPTQLIEYMRSKGFKPKAPKEGTLPDIAIDAMRISEPSPKPSYPQGHSAYPVDQGPGMYSGGPDEASYPSSQGQASYPVGQAPYPGGQRQAPYPGSQGQAPYPSAQGQAPYPGGHGQAAYPGGQAQSGAGYPGASGQGASSYPPPLVQGRYPFPLGQSSSPYPSSSGTGASPYPAPPGQGTAPYPGPQGQGTAPYPGPPGQGTAPYPGPPGQGTAPYPGPPGQGTAPYPGPPGQGTAPYPGLPGQGTAPYPGPPGQGAAPYPGPPGQGATPYPGPPGQGTAPYPGPPGQGTAPYPGPPGQGTAPYSAPSGKGTAPYPTPSGQGSSPYPSASAPYPGSAPYSTTGSRGSRDASAPPL